MIEWECFMLGGWEVYKGCALLQFGGVRWRGHSVKLRGPAEAKQGPQLWSLEVKPVLCRR